MKAREQLEAERLHGKARREIVEAARAEARAALEQQAKDDSTRGAGDSS